MLEDSKPEQKKQIKSQTEKALPLQESTKLDELNIVEDSSVTNLDVSSYMGIITIVSLKIIFTCFSYIMTEPWRNKQLYI